jgi:uncharacterized delta-60 repeat protein
MSDAVTAIAAPAPNTAPTFTAQPPGTWLSFAPEDDSAVKVFALDDSTLLVATGVPGGTTAGAVLLDADGLPDASYHQAIPASATLAGATQVFDAALDADGRLVEAGFTNVAGHNQFTVLRFNADGSLDSGFDGDGIASTAVGTRNDQGRAVFVQADGKIVVGGNTQTDTASSARDFALVRYNTDGSLDTTFDGDGIAVTPSPGTSDAIAALLDGGNGKILAVGTSFVSGSTSVVIARYGSDGSLDATFGTGGLESTAINSAFIAFSVAKAMVQSDGKIVVTGIDDLGSNDGTRASYVMRFNADGTPDNTVGTNGLAQMHLSDWHLESLAGVVQQADGKLVLAGLAFYSDTSNLPVLLRLNTDGTLDTTFGDNGFARTPYPQPADGDYSGVALDADGNIVVTGRIGHAGTPFPTGYDTVVVRYTADGVLDTSFAAPATLGNTVTYTEHAGAVLLDAHAAVQDAELSAANNYGGSTLTLQRHDGASVQDVFAGNGHVLLSNGAASVDGTTVGAYTQAGGVLTVSFGDGATQAQVNQLLQGIGYANASDAPPASVTIDWSFSDGDATGPLSATGSTTVNIQAADATPIPGRVVEGTDGNDVLSAGSRTRILEGGAGDDVYVLSGRAKVVEAGGEGIDTVQTSGGRFTLPGNVENLVLTGSRNGSATGNALDNQITGNDGANKIAGEAGADTLTGGAGADTFYYRATVDSSFDGGVDVITDFSSADGDRIDLRGIDADTTRGGNQAFVFDGGAPQVKGGAVGHLYFDGGTHTLWGNTGDGAQFALVLTGVDSLSAFDVRL